MCVPHQSAWRWQQGWGLDQVLRGPVARQPEAGSTAGLATPRPPPDGSIG